MDGRDGAGRRCALRARCCTYGDVQRKRNVSGSPDLGLGALTEEGQMPPAWPAWAAIVTKMINSINIKIRDRPDRPHWLRSHRPVPYNVLVNGSHFDICPESSSRLHHAASPPIFFGATDGWHGLM
jgi:hypothetical protein